MLLFAYEMINENVKVFKYQTKELGKNLYKTFYEAIFRL